MSDQGQITTHAEWAVAIKFRDGFRCQRCNSCEYLHAHHIQHRRVRPDLALILENGITLCDECHAQAHDGNPAIARRIRLLKYRVASSGPRKKIALKEDQTVKLPDMQAPELADWMASRGLSHRGIAKAAMALDISINRLNRFLDGSVRIPKHIALACAAISHLLPPWRA